MTAKVVVGIATKGSISESLFSTLPILKPEEVLINTEFPLDKARNSIAREFLAKTEGTHLLWLDDDVGVPKNINELIELGEHEPLVAPLCFMAISGQIVPGIFKWCHEWPNRITSWSLQQAVEHIDECKAKGIPPIAKPIDAVGGGMWMASRECLERSCNTKGEWFKMSYYDDAGRPAYGEDLYFFELAEAKGYKFAVHLDVIPSHMKIQCLGYWGKRMLDWTREGKRVMKKVKDSENAIKGVTVVDD